jgi:hypothetical protein
MRTRDEVFGEPLWDGQREKDGFWDRLARKVAGDKHHLEEWIGDGWERVWCAQLQQLIRIWPVVPGRRYRVRDPQGKLVWVGTQPEDSYAPPSYLQRLAAEKGEQHGTCIETDVSSSQAHR